MSAIRVVIADDDDYVRTAMVEVLIAHGDFDVVAVAADGVGIAALAAESRADVVLVDVGMPAGGSEAARAVTAGSGSSPVVIAVSGHTDAAHVLAMLEAGATGYLAKWTLGDTFPADVARCAHGDVVLAVPQAAQVLRSLVRDARSEGA